MKSQRNEDLIGLLTCDEANIRMLALHLLCESYAVDRKVFDGVCAGWDQWGPADAFVEFPMLSYLPIPESAVVESCERAATMASGRKLTDPVARCAGKLLEQVVYLPVRSLEPHLPLLSSTVEKSKIFFRVDLDGTRDRIALASLPADDLAAVLNESITNLGKDANDAVSVHRGLHALEALRREHPDYMDLAAVIRQTPPADGPTALSFQLTLQSLIQFEQPGLESLLADRLLDEREAIYTSVVEALVRAGGHDAARAFVSVFPTANEGNQRWIARGLQRIRVEGLAEEISSLRSKVSDPKIWLMLLIAEVRQFAPESCERIVADVAKLASFSETLIDSLSVFSRLNQDAENGRAVQGAFMEYLKQANQALSGQLQKQRKKLRHGERKLREKQRQSLIDRYRNEL